MERKAGVGGRAAMVWEEGATSMGGCGVAGRESVSEGREGSGPGLA